MGCPENSGAAGTLFDVSLQTLTISNEGRHTRTRTPLFDFPNHPLWTNFVMDDQAKVVVLSLWSRVQVRAGCEENAFDSTFH